MAPTVARGRAIGSPPCDPPPRHLRPRPSRGWASGRWRGAPAPPPRTPATCSRPSCSAGGTLVDTAHGYAGGAAEDLLGDLLEGPDRDEVVLVTKSGISRSTGSRVVDCSRRRADAPARHLAAPAAHRPRRRVARPHLGRAHAHRGDGQRAGLGGGVRTGPLRRGVQPRRLAGRAHDVAARGIRRPVGGELRRVQPGRSDTRAASSWMPRRRWASGCSRGPRSDAGCWPGATAPPWPRTRGWPPRSSRGSPGGTSATTPGASSRRCTPRPAGSAWPRPSSPSPGCGTGRESPRRSSAPAP